MVMWGSNHLFQCDNCFRCLRVQDAARETPDGLRFVQGRDGSGRRTPCTTAEDADPGRGTAREGEETEGMNSYFEGLIFA